MRVTHHLRDGQSLACTRSSPLLKLGFRIRKWPLGVGFKRKESLLEFLVQATMTPIKCKQ